VEEVTKRGIHVDEFAPRLSFLLSCGIRLFEEVAKFRATRRVWAKIMRDRFHARNPKSMMLRMFSGCQGSGFTDREPLNNISRSMIMSLVAVLAGCQAIHTTAYDEAYAIPTEESTRTALRTQQILAYETDVASVVDPMGGSYFLEHLTNRIEKAIEDEMNKIELKGGILQGIIDGSIQREIARQAYEEALRIESGEKIIVGFNKFTSKTEKKGDIETHQADPETLRRQVQRLKEIKKQRDNNRVSELLEEISRAAQGRVNLIGPILAAVHEYATVGEICDTLRDVFGEYQEN
jgi:methylmalonyl-CoA mutase N-terminal domain/subunit